MRKTKLLLIALMAMMGLGVNAADKVVGEKFTTIGELDGKLFCLFRWRFVRDRRCQEQQ